MENAGRTQPLKGHAPMGTGWPSSHFRFTKKRGWGLGSDLGNGPDVLELGQRSVRGCNPLKFIELTTPLPMRAGLVLNKQLAAQTRTLLKKI